MSKEINTDDIYNRTEIILGKESIQKIKNSKVCICGIGGVGSFAMEALARIGVRYITVIDKDKVDATNINRQLIATVDNVNNPKVKVGEERIKSINPNIDVKTHEIFITKDNIAEYIDNTYDYVIDAIDSVESKVALIKYCYTNNINVISSMGMANRINPLDIKVADLYKTKMCPLAKIMRKKLKELDVEKLKVVYSEENAIKPNAKELGSVSFVPSVAGLVIASEVIKDIIK